MLLIIFLYFSKIKIVYSPIVVHPSRMVSLFITKTCYKSNSYPIEFFELWHSFPTGPLNLYMVSQMLITTNDTDSPQINFTRENLLMRLNDPCLSSLKYNIREINITKMNLIISIYLLDKKSKIAEIIYEFRNGFKIGSYLLVGIFSNFAVSANILSFKEEHYEDMTIPFHNWPSSQMIAEKYQDLCVVTPQNMVVILRPSYEEGSGHGFITKLIGKHSKEEITKKNDYTAFECQSDELFINEKIVFIEEDSVDADLSFSVISYLKDFGDLVKKEVSITIPNSQTIKVNQMKNIGPGKKRVIFTHGTGYLGFDIEKGDLIVTYESENKILYDLRRFEAEFVSKRVIRRISTTDPL